MRKAIHIFALLLIASLRLSGQSIKNLDTDNGFGHFQFGQKPLELTDIKQIRTRLYQKDFVREYIYTGKDVPAINAMKVTAVILSFYENRLFGIRVCFDTTSASQVTEDFNKVQLWLESKYGKEWHTTPSEGNTDMTGRTWKATTVSLDHLMSIKGYSYINFIERKLYSEVITLK